MLNTNLLDIFPVAPVIEQEKIDRMHLESKMLYDKKHNKVKRKRRVKKIDFEEDVYSLRLRDV